MTPQPGETETGAPPEPSAWMTPSRGSTGWGFNLTPRRQDDTSVPLYTLDAAERVIRERVAAELEADVERLRLTDAAHYKRGMLRAITLVREGRET